MKTGFAAALLAVFVCAVALAGKTYKSTSPIPCSELWPAEKTVLAD